MSRALRRLPLLALAAGCLALSSPTNAAQPAAASAASGSVAPETYPALTSDVLFSLIASEVAAQRNMPASAYATLLATAKETGNTGIAKRAFEIADLAGASNEARDAAALWEELATDPADKRLAAAFKDVRDSRYSAAEPALAQALAESRAPEKLFEQIYAAFNGKRTLEAFPVLERLAAPVIEKGSSASPALILATMAVQAGKGPKAADYALKAIEKAPENEKVFARAIPLVAAASPELAKAPIEKYLGSHPEAGGPRLLYAHVLKKLHEDEKAKEQISRIAAAKLNAAQWFQLGVLAESSGMASDAADFYKKSLGKPGGDTGLDADRSRFRLAILAEQGKRSEEAIDWYVKITGGKLLVPARVRAAFLLMEAGQSDRAIEALSSGKPEGAEDEAALSAALSALFVKQGETRRAYDAMKKAATKAPKNAEFLYDTAMLAEKLARGAEAELYLRKALAVDPDSPTTNNALGYLLADRGENLPEARRLIERANTAKPNDPFILDSLGWVWHRLGDEKKALGYLRESLRLRYDPETAAHLAEVEAKLGDKVRAADLVRDGLEKHPDNELLLKLKKKLELP